MKYFILPGGVISGLGKGTTISSIGVLLKMAGFRVTSIKIDPYLVCILVIIILRMLMQVQCHHTNTEKSLFVMMVAKQI